MTAHTQGTLILKAIEFASRKHKGQVRKVSGEKYITHPLLVSYLVAQYKTSKNLETLICAALLHDTVEDTKTTYTEILREFGIEVAQLVFELTSDPTELKRVGKVEYLRNKMRGMSSYALYLKLCDRLGNMMDHPSEKQVRETRELLASLKKTRKLSKSHLAVIKEIEALLI
jgi:(p)ppGpp synthase/HD superfamily hydrolase